MLSIMGGLLGSMASSLLGSSQAVQPFEELAEAKLTLYPLNPAGEPISMFGVDHLTLQENPEEHKLPKRVASYILKEAPRTLLPFSHFTGTKLEPFPLDLVLFDWYEGPPHAIRRPSGTTEATDFSDLFEVLYWIDGFGLPIPEFEVPPLIKVEWGPYSQIGAVTSINSDIVRKYPSGYPLIAEVRMTIRPEVVENPLDSERFKVD